MENAPHPSFLPAHHTTLSVFEFEKYAQNPKKPHPPPSTPSTGFSVSLFVDLIKRRSKFYKNRTKLGTFHAFNTSIVDALGLLISEEGQRGEGGFEIFGSSPLKEPALDMVYGSSLTELKKLNFQTPPKDLAYLDVLLTYKTVHICEIDDFEQVSQIVLDLSAELVKTDT